eukprot:jgi/Chrzof1/12731/Cz07g05160.t1
MTSQLKMSRSRIDTEGFEMEAIKGAEGLLTNHNVWYLMTECNVDIIEEKGKQEYLRFLDKTGCYISYTGFKGQS